MALKTRWEMEAEKKGWQKGWQKGKNQGKKKGIVYSLLRVLELRYGDVPNWV